MNLHNLDLLITRIELAVEHDEFDISKFAHECGTPACIAGYASAMQGEKTPHIPRWNSLNADQNRELVDGYKTHLQNFLEISFEEAEEIATGFENGDGGWVTLPTPEQALEFLQLMRSRKRPITWEEFTPCE